MIVDYKYCGYSTNNRYGNTHIWGAVTFVENGFTQTYMFWGSPKAPIIRKYSYGRRSKKETLAYKIKERRTGWSGYVELKDAEIEYHFPELSSQIGMYILDRKLKGK